MLGAFQRFGRMGSGASAWSERALWPLGASSPGLWIDPSYPASEFQDSAGTTALSTVGTVLDSSNPVGLILDRKAGATSNTGAGIHLSQSTSAARPLASARVNLLTYSEDMSNGAWLRTGVSTTATRMTEDSSTGPHTLLNGGGLIRAQTASVRASEGTRRYLTIWSGAVDTMHCTFDLQAGVITQHGAGASSASISHASEGGFWCKVAFSSDGAIRFSTATSGTPGWNPSHAGDGAKYLDIYASHFELGTTPTKYQRVGAASDYTATGFPVYLKLDGTDDGIASATLSAGTLTSSMDCLIALRRDSAERFILFYQAVGVGSFYFGLVDAAGGTSPCFNASGSPTVWVDGAQVSSGRASDLSTALTLGSWHILEFRGMDLSAWTRLQSGFWAGGYGFNGAIGKAYLFASGQDANRTKARARMAAYFGVTLP